MREVTEASIRKTDDGKFHAYIEYIGTDGRVEDSDNFDSFEEANAWLADQESGEQSATAPADPNQERLDQTELTGDPVTDETAASDTLQNQNEDAQAAQTESESGDGESN